MDSTQVAECSGISVLLAILPTIGLIISEILPYIGKDKKCNGLLQTAICAIKHLINKEPCSVEEIQEAIERFTPNNSPRVLNSNEAGQTPNNSPVDIIDV
tara:strand:+ start:914 stop:1213 length:300 start_codon:yes stop_codon:yes gene_type:complete